MCEQHTEYVGERKSTLARNNGQDCPHQLNIVAVACTSLKTNICVIANYEMNSGRKHAGDRMFECECKKGGNVIYTGRCTVYGGLVVRYMRKEKNGENAEKMNTTEKRTHQRGSKSKTWARRTIMDVQNSTMACSYKFKRPIAAKRVHTLERLDNIITLPVLCFCLCS